MEKGWPFASIMPPFESLFGMKWLLEREEWSNSRPENVTAFTKHLDSYYVIASLSSEEVLFLATDDRMKLITGRSSLNEVICIINLHHPAWPTASTCSTNGGGLRAERALGTFFFTTVCNEQRGCSLTSCSPVQNWNRSKPLCLLNVEKA